MTPRRLAALMLMILGAALVLLSIPASMGWLKVLMVFGGFALVFSGGVVLRLLQRK